MTPRRTLKINSRSSSQDRTPIPSQLPADRTTTQKPAAAAHRRLLHFDLAYNEANTIGQSLNATLDMLRGGQGISIPDRVRFVLYGLGTIIRTPFSCAHHAFAVQAANAPDAIAVEHGHISKLTHFFLTLQTLQTWAKSHKSMKTTSEQVVFKRYIQVDQVDQVQK
jgi:hypothetical protein